MRLLLECHALQLSFAAGDMDWEGRIVSAHHKLSLMEKRMLAGDRSEAETWKRYDREFHHALISACGSKALLETHAAIYDKYLRYQMIAVVFRGEVAAREHQRLLQHALQREAQAAQKILVAHIQDCVEDTPRPGHPALVIDVANREIVVAPVATNHDTAGERAYRRVRADILMGRLPPARSSSSIG